MTHAEFENLLLLTDRLTGICEPKKMEYWKGYRSGIEFHFHNCLQESVPDHYSILDTARRNGSRDIDSYARGYLDGCRGRKPEGS